MSVGRKWGPCSVYIFKALQALSMGSQGGDSAAGSPGAFQRMRARASVSASTRVPASGHGPIDRDPSTGLTASCVCPRCLKLDPSKTEPSLPAPLAGPRGSWPVVGSWAQVWGTRVILRRKQRTKHKRVWRQSEARHSRVREPKGESQPRSERRAGGRGSRKAGPHEGPSAVTTRALCCGPQTRVERKTETAEPREHRRPGRRTGTAFA